ncbi:MAG: hypothetical protein P4L42_00205 [Desulfocapsaceae bacterium]|nr:hypothetical protein [Desulfocapsaceae bacterium]
MNLDPGYLKAGSEKLSFGLRLIGIIMDLLGFVLTIAGSLSLYIVANTGFERIVVSVLIIIFARLKDISIQNANSIMFIDKRFLQLLSVTEAVFRETISEVIPSLDIRNVGDRLEVKFLEKYSRDNLFRDHYEYANDIVNRTESNLGMKSCMRTQQILKLVLYVIGVFNIGKVVLLSI